MAVKKDNNEGNEVVKNTKRTTTIIIPIDPLNPNKESEFFSVNNKNYQVKIGEEVEVPIEVYEVWKHSEEMKRKSMDYINKKRFKEENNN